MIDSDHDLHGPGARELVTAGVDRLSGRERRVIELRYFEGLDTPAIAARLGLTERQVALLTERAFVHMRERIDDADFDDAPHLERVLIRLEPVLHRRLAATAEDERVPLETLITTTLQRATDGPAMLHPPPPPPEPRSAALLKATLVAVVAAIVLGLVLVVLALERGW